MIENSCQNCSLGKLESSAIDAYVRSICKSCILSSNFVKSAKAPGSVLKSRQGVGDLRVITRENRIHRGFRKDFEEFV